MTDSDFHRVQVFDNDGAFLDQWGTRGSGDGEFRSPSGIAIDAGGDVYVSDSRNDRVQKFDADGTYLDQWGGPGSGNGQLSDPADLEIDAGGDVLVVDSDNHRVQQFDSDGTYVSQFGSLGSDPGELRNPLGIEIVPGGNLYVADGGNHRVQRFSGAGAFQLEWGQAGTATGRFLSPVDVAADSSGDLYVSDRENRRIQKFDADGDFLLYWKRGLSAPQGLTIDGDDNLFVANTGGDFGGVVQKYGEGGTDVVAPVITLTSEIDAGRGKAMFTFSATDNVTASPALRCGLSRRKRERFPGGFVFTRWVPIRGSDPCPSPRAYRRLKAGTYLFEVYATDEAGVVQFKNKVFRSNR